MKRKKLFSGLLFLLLTVMLLIPVSVQAAAAKPGTVKLSSVKATDYNKINIKWDKTSGATNYIVYYRESGDKKWIKVKTLDNKKTSYTHTSSSKYPIIVGKKYQYTVKAYNKKTKKSGKYNTKGLTASTVPQTVKLISATYDKDTEGVTISWKKAG
ncbi:fibronectin type III domain-containing protein, partial [Blautia sp. HCP3S3_C4]|uniref:fibronectin type III domain-containing protein n=1 Tax=Blautia sp. HCP3S3_C4 TaxID=3438911 RepID=UPI003F8C7FD9